VQSSFTDTRFKIVFSAFWFIWSVVHYSVMLKFNTTQTEALTDSVVSNALLAAGCLLISNNMKYYLPREERYWYILIISLVIGFIWLVITRLILWMLFKGDVQYTDMLSRSSTIRHAIAFLILGGMACISLLWYTQKEQQQMNAHRTEAEQLAKEAELFKLRQQLQPHFLFNSLNSISALTGTQPEKARHMINQLSEFLRGTLKKDEKQWNTLVEEMQYLELYLEIEKVRFGHRLQTDIICGDDALNLKLPSMLLQPVVENAIKFGLYDTTGEVLIKLNAKKLDNNLEVTVENPFDPETSMPLKGTGFGLASIQRRLFLLFARQDLLNVQKENNRFITTILIPQNI
jgi:two-component system, LytTR family, sensor kinase